MIFQENSLLADDSREISYLIFMRKLGKMSHNLSSDDQSEISMHMHGTYVKYGICTVMINMRVILMVMGQLGSMYVRVRTVHLRSVLHD